MKSLIIFGITGDLARKKLIPTLLNLKRKVKIYGVGRKNPSEIQIPKNFNYIQGAFDDPNLYSQLAQVEGERLFYLAVPPDLYEAVLKRLIVKTTDKILIEKPFGNDLKSARKLNKLLLKKFKEKQIYRVDHYLGKKELKNLKIERRKDIEKIEIKILEKQGINGRGIFYDKVGALRDVGQNHMLAIFGALTKGKVADLKLIEAESSQYQGYLGEPGVDPKSKTETHFKIQASWKGIPIILESGKKMKVNKVEVAVIYKNKKEPKIFPIESGGYDRIFLDALSGKKDIFPKLPEISAQWKFIEKVKRELLRRSA
jgi:glucose-6-phosphate 1-dehydrogenase